MSLPRKVSVTCLRYLITESHSTNYILRKYIPFPESHQGQVDPFGEYSSGIQWYSGPLVLWHQVMLA